MKMMMIHCAWLLASCLLVSACEPSPERKIQIAEDKRLHCLDHLCDGDIQPKHDILKEVAIKLNGQWFVGPKEYFSTGSNGAHFEWWEHKPLSSSMTRPPEMQRLSIEGKGYDFSIEVFLRSNHIPPEPHGYKLIELAEAKGWIQSRVTLRPGLDAIKMKHVIGPDGYYIDHLTYYVATNLKGVDGLPPVGGCSHDDPRNQGGTGFMWQSGIWAGARMNQKHCADWPEIFQEISRVLQLLKKA
jgi:hypothetical protein